MKKSALRSFIALVVLLPAAVAAYGAEGTVEDILARMEQADKKITTASFSFTQEIEYTLTKEKQTSSGEAAFMRPNSVYVKQKSALEQVIITDGKKVWIYTPAYKQALVDDWKKWSQSSMVPSSLLNFGENYASLKKRYSFTLEGMDGGDYVLLLSPRAKEAWRLKLWIKPDTMVPVKAVLYGENIAVTTRVADYKINPPLDKKLFVFQPPPGVEVLNVP